MVRVKAVRLDRARIVDAALTIAARDGAPAVTMRRLGSELGVDATAFYRHFRTKDDLVAAMAERLMERELEAIDLSGDWRENLRQLCWGGWRVYRGHPGFAESIARLPDDGDVLARIADRMFVELRRAGLSRMRRGAVLPLVGRPDRRHRAVPGDRAAAGQRLTAGPSCGARSPRCRRARTRPLHDVGEYLYPPVEQVFANSVELLLDAIELRSARETQRHEEER